jgi:hypothetical protein
MHVQMLFTVLSVIIKPLVPQSSNSFACHATVDSLNTFDNFVFHSPCGPQYLYMPVGPDLVNPSLSLDDQATCSLTATYTLMIDQLHG